MRVVATGITDVGRKRDRNEDACLVSDELRLYLVADGMGGHAGGQYASSLAVDTVEEVVEQLGRVTRRPQGEDPVDVMRAAVDRAVRTAGRRIHGFAAEHPEFHGMGTTIVLLAIQDQNAFVAHVGDSRAYLLRDDAIEQITDDHSLVAQSVREGLLTEAQARGHKMRNVITRALGFNADVEVDVQVRALRRGDLWLLCSDGLSGKVEPDEMRRILDEHDLSEAARQLVGLACARGGDDNITAVLVRVEDAA